MSLPSPEQLEAAGYLQLPSQEDGGADEVPLATYQMALRLRAADRAMAALRASLLDAENAIGQVLRYAGTLEMEGGQFAEAGRWLLGELAPWLGEGRSGEESREH